MTHRFTGLDAFDAAVREAKAERQATWLRLVGIALLRRALTLPRAATLGPPRIEVVIDDQRTVKEPPLPTEPRK